MRCLRKQTLCWDPAYRWSSFRVATNRRIAQTEAFSTCLQSFVAANDKLSLMRSMTLAFLCSTLLLQGSVFSQVGKGPKQMPFPPAIEQPQDVGFKGVMDIAVDATDTAHKIYSVHEVLPVQRGGPMVLLYPQWDSGSHAATGSIANLAGLFVQRWTSLSETRTHPRHCRFAGAIALDTSASNYLN